MRWDTFRESSPELAAYAEERFAVTELVMLGTLRKDGFPRISPIEYTFFDGELTLGGIWQAKKALDLLRDSRCTVHSVTSNKNGQEGDVKLWGHGLHVTDGAWLERYWQHIWETIHFRPAGPAHVFTIDISEAAYVRFTGEGVMEWLTWPGNRWRSRRSE